MVATCLRCSVISRLTAARVRVAWSRVSIILRSSWSSRAATVSSADARSMKPPGLLLLSSADIGPRRPVR